MKTSFFFMATLVVFQLFYSSTTASAETYYTWEGFEPDKLASIWLLKHSVDSNATIKILPKNSTLSNATPFDTPTAQLRRYHTESTFESIIRVFKIKDSRINCIGAIIHEIEINKWNTVNNQQSGQIQKEIWAIIDTAGDKQSIINSSAVYFDKLFNDCQTASLPKNQ